MKRITEWAEAKPLSPELRGQIAAIRANAAILKGDAGLAIEQSERAIDLLPPDDPSLAGVLLVLGNAVQKIGDVSRSIQLLQEAVAQSRRTNDLSTLLTSCAYLAAGLSLQGKLHQVETVLLEALEEVNSQLGASDWPLPMLAMIYQRLGLVKKEWDDLAGAEQVLTRALRIAENSDYLSAVANAYGGLASLRCSQRRFDQAIELVEKALQMIPRRKSSLYIDLLQALRAEYWIYSGNLPAARRWAEERGLSAERAIDYVGANELYPLARLWIAEDRADEADATCCQRGGVWGSERAAGLDDHLPGAASAGSPRRRAAGSCRSKPGACTDPGGAGRIFARISR